MNTEEIIVENKHIKRYIEERSNTLPDVNSIGYFTWHIINGFIIEVNKKKYIWNYRHNQYDNFIRPIIDKPNTFYNRIIKFVKSLFKTRHEGYYRIGDFCGENVKFIFNNEK